MMKKNAVIFMGKRSVAIAILLVITSAIFISVASAATTTYDYSSGATTNKWAWEVVWDKIPPVIPTVEIITPLTTEQYGWISTPNDVRWLMSDPGHSNYISMKSTIDIQESAASITNILFHGEAYKTGTRPREVRVYGYNQITSAWVYFGSGTVPASPPDGTVEVSLTADFDHYIDADGKMTWCFFLNRQGRTLYLDYIKVDVTYITPTWVSDYETYDSTHHIVHMTGDGFIAGHAYHVGYYDANGDKQASETGSLDGTALSSQYDCTSHPLAQYGTSWHAVVFDDAVGSPPEAYAACSGAAGYVVEDYFEVEQSAIPEFPTVIAAIAVCLLCAVAYVVTRRKAGRGDG